MRTVKREVLRLVTAFIAGSDREKIRIIVKDFLPPLLPTVLEDYKYIVCSLFLCD